MTYAILLILMHLAMLPIFIYLKRRWQKKSKKKSHGNNP